MTKGAVSQWENGLTTPELATLQKIAEVTNTSAEWLLTGGEPDETVRAQTTDELAVLAEMRKVGLQNQAAIRAIVTAYAASLKKT